ncbi:MAG: LssY C-terminal domain-containing protein [Coxiellaceae bacterium]|nr:LssY C-terminal domain-containing protein [Coxiellaceae bacterium]
MDSHHLFQIILAYLHQNPQMGIWFAFAIAFSESLPIIGTIIPGSITMTIVGVLMGSGGLPLLPTLLVASVAAFLGDCIGYSLGFYYNERLRTMWPFKNHLKWLTMGETFFKKHGGKSIIVGRFFGPARSTVPMVAGLLKLSWLRFIFAAIPSALMWATIYLIPGVLLGALSREIPKEETTRFLIYGVCGIIILFTAFWAVQRFFTELSRGINKLTDRCWQKLMHRHSGKIILRLIANQENPRDHHPLTFLFCAVFSGTLFLILFFNVRMHGVLTSINYPTFHVLQSIRSTSLDHFFTAFTVFGEPKSVPCVAVLLSLGLWFLKQKRAAIHLIITTALAIGAAGFFKLLSHSARPNGFFKIDHSSSFPSGHVTISLAVFFFIAHLFAHRLPRSIRSIPYVIAAILVLFIGFSRLYLGAHWVDDVIGAILCGTTILLLCIISYRRLPSKMNAQHLSAKKTVAVLLIGLITPSLLFFPLDYMKTLRNMQPVQSNQVITLEDWWNSPEINVPLYRNNRFGKPFQPFNVQWKAPLQTIEKNLTANGWQSIEIHPKLKTTLARFGSNDAKYHMPLFPWLYQDQMPALIMIKHIPMQKRVIELHLWNSNIHFMSQKDPLWIGTIDIRIPPKILLSLKDQTKISLVGDGGLSELYEDTSSCERKYISSSTTSIPNDIKALKWDGNILIIHCH